MAAPAQAKQCTFLNRIFPEGYSVSCEGRMIAPYATFPVSWIKTSEEDVKINEASSSLSCQNPEQIIQTHLPSIRSVVERCFQDFENTRCSQVTKQHLQLLMSHHQASKLHVSIPTIHYRPEENTFHAFASVFPVGVRLENEEMDPLPNRRFHREVSFLDRTFSIVEMAKEDPSEGSFLAFVSFSFNGLSEDAKKNLLDQTRHLPECEFEPFNDAVDTMAQEITNAVIGQLPATVASLKPGYAEKLRRDLSSDEYASYDTLTIHLEMLVYNPETQQVNGEAVLTATQSPPSDSEEKESS